MRVPYDPPQYCPHGRERWKKQELAFTGAILDCPCCGNLYGYMGPLKPGESLEPKLCTECADNVD